eukprot:1153165-Pelagomonas_calceolata.AAC.1
MVVEKEWRDGACFDAVCIKGSPQCGPAVTGHMVVIIVRPRHKLGTYNSAHFRSFHTVESTVAVHVESTVAIHLVVVHGAVTYCKLLSILAIQSTVQATIHSGNSCSGGSTWCPWCGYPLQATVVDMVHTGGSIKPWHTFKPSVAGMGKTSSTKYMCASHSARNSRLT